MAEGFIDLQVNGHKGVDFTAADLSVEQLAEATFALAALGTQAYLPTIITSPVRNIERNLSIAAEAIETPELSPFLLGIHLEGPFLSVKCKGAHPADCIIPPDLEQFKRFQDAAQGQIKLLTLAPENDGAIELIRYATEQGVVISLGHHFADADTVNAAVDAGASLCTHLGNAMPRELNKFDNPLIHQLSNEGLRAMQITDGQHLPESFIKLTLAAKGPDNYIVVSDAAPIAGCPPGEYNSLGSEVMLHEDKRITLKTDPTTLAGSSATMLDCMNHLASLNLLNEEELWAVAYHNPLNALGIHNFSPDKRAASVSFKDQSFQL